MIQLIIWDKEEKFYLDIDQNTNISFDYKQTDFDKPTKTKNTFSKTVTLKGTNTNNAAFGQIWNLERTFDESGDVANIGVNFDPKQRVNFTLVKDGNIVEDGYLSLDAININNGNITYSITLYGGLGNFFYNLSYNDKLQKELNLSNLYWKIKDEGGEIMTEDDENTKPLFAYDRNYIINSWNRLQQETSTDEGITVEDTFVPIPTYSGVYDDFNNSKLLYRYGVNSSLDSSYFKNAITDGYTAFDDKYLTLELSRDISEWEAKDLRSEYQRIGIKFSDLFNTICDPHNNGGYTVTTDQEILDSTYFKDTYLVLDRLKFDEDTTANEVIEINHSSKILEYNFSGEKPTTQHVPTDNPNVNTKGWSKIGTYDTSNMLNPKAKINLFFNKLYTSGTTHKSATVVGGWSNDFFWSTCGGVATKIAIFKDGEFYGYVGNKLSFCTFGDDPNMAIDQLWCGEVSGDNKYQSNRLCPKFAELLGLQNFNQQTVELTTMKFTQVQGATTTKTYRTDPLAFGEFELPKGQIDLYLWQTFAQVDGAPVAHFGEGVYDKFPSGAPDDGFYTQYLDKMWSKSNNPQISTWVFWEDSNRVDMNCKPNTKYEIYFYAKADDNYDLMRYNTFSGSHNLFAWLTDYWINYGQWTQHFTTHNDLSGQIGSDATKRIYSQVFDNVSINVQPTIVNKQILLGGTHSPYDYLISFSKALNLKYEYDSINRTVYIKQRGNYYKDEVVNIDDKIDYSKEVKIIPTTSVNKFYEYGFKTADTYADYMYNNKNIVQYGHTKINTNYDFNNNTVNLFDDVIYTSAIPFQLSSIYFNQIRHSNKYLPTALLSPTINTTAYKYEEGELKDNSVVLNGYSRKNVNLLNKKDTMPKLCMFDRSNNNVGDLTDCLVFFDGVYKDNQGVLISDNNEDMFILTENACFMCAYNDSGDNYTRVYNIPKFSKYRTDENAVIVDSLDYAAPQYTFISNSPSYSDGATIYDRFWKGYISDIYDTDSKQVTLNVMLKDEPKEAMKKFYLFKNSLWVINEIKSYNINETNKSIKCTFIKVKDKANYLSKFVK